MAKFRVCQRFVALLPGRSRQQVWSRNGYAHVERNEESAQSRTRSRSTLLQLVSTCLYTTNPTATYLLSVHDGDIVPFLASLELFPEPSGLPTSYVKTDRNWRTSTIVPMGGRVILERLARKVDSPKQRHYVRININDAIVPIPGCDSGPGQSCRLDLFTDLVDKRRHQLADFRQLCGLSEDTPDRITFLHQ